MQSTCPPKTSRCPQTRQIRPRKDCTGQALTAATTPQEFDCRCLLGIHSHQSSIAGPLNASARRECRQSVASANSMQILTQRTIKTGIRAKRKTLQVTDPSSTASVAVSPWEPMQIPKQPRDSAKPTIAIASSPMTT